MYLPLESERKSDGRVLIVIEYTHEKKEGAIAKAIKYGTTNKISASKHNLFNKFA